ncbi:MAG TPA: peptidyl-prolyl cis-trans isomerase, partial [Gemmataceae bacterium]
MRRLERNRGGALAVLAALGMSAAGCAGDTALTDRPPPLALPSEGNAPAGWGLLSVEPTASGGPESPAVLRMQKPDEAVSPVAYAPELPPDAEPQVRIVAMVGKTPVYDGEVREAVSQRLAELIDLAPAARAARRDEIYREELRRLVERELILTDMFAKLEKARPQVIEELREAAAKEADKRFREFRKQRGLSGEEEFESLLRSQGLSLKGLRRQIERNFMMSEYIRNLVFPKVNRISLGQIREYYDEHPEEFRAEDRVKWQDLFVRADQFPSRQEAKRFAEQLAARARGGEDFVELVKQYDQGDSVLRDGAGVGEKRGEIRPPEVEAVVFSLKEGEVGPVVEMAGGFHVVRVAQRQYAGQRPFDIETQNEIRRKLQNRLGQVEY